MTPEESPKCMDTSPEAEPTPAPTSIPNIKDWAHLLRTHTHEEFAALALVQEDYSCPPALDISGVALIRPSQIHRYVFGEW